MLVLKHMEVFVEKGVMFSIYLAKYTLLRAWRRPEGAADRGEEYVRTGIVADGSDLTRKIEESDLTRKIEGSDARRALQAYLAGTENRTVGTLAQFLMQCKWHSQKQPLTYRSTFCKFSSLC